MESFYIICFFRYYFFSIIFVDMYSGQYWTFHLNGGGNEQIYLAKRTEFI